MICEKIDLYEYFRIPREGRTGGYLTAYAPEPLTEVKPKIRPAMLVVPGGGYGFISEREGEPVAVCFICAGFAAFTLVYTILAAYPVPFIEAGMAMAYIRLNADKYGVDKTKVAAIGFSAGGHLTGLLATMFGDKSLKETLGKNAALVRPDAVILSYPVITTGQKTHGGSAETVSGGNAELREMLSVEKRVTKNSPPAFIWHTFEDDCVPVENALLAAKAYRENGVPFELHIFEKGWHGASVLNREVNDGEIPEEVRRNEVWVALALSWLKTRGFSVREKETV